MKQITKFRLKRMAGGVGLSSLCMLLNCAQAAQFASGDVLASRADVILWLDASGQEYNPQRRLSGGGLSGWTGGAFDAAGNFLVTGADSGGGAIAVFDNSGAYSASASFHSPGGLSVESIAFDQSGKFYVAAHGGSGALFKYNSARNLEATLFSGTRFDWIQLAADGCTLYYTDEGSTTTAIHKADVCTGIKLGDFAQVANVKCLASFAIRLLPSGGLLVAAGCTVQRFDPNGCLVQVYGADGAYHDYFSLALTADGQSFWVGDLSASTVSRFDLCTGALLTAPLAAGGAGLSVYGASTPVPAPCLAAGTLDAGFDPGAGSGQYSTVYGIARQCDGKFLIASEGSTPLLRLKPDGSQDTSFAPNIDNTVFAVIVQPDGKILIAGKFHQVNSQNNSYGLARLNSDGSSDLTFHTGQQLAGYYRAMALQSDGKILASHSVLGIKRYYSDSSQDFSWNTPLPNNMVYSMALQADGNKLVIGGSFTSINSVARNRIARLNNDGVSDGTLDTSFDPVVGPNSTVYAVSVPSDGGILIGGLFTSYQGQTRNRVARLDPVGNLDTSFNPGSGPNLVVYCLACDKGGLIGGTFASGVLIGGSFTSVNTATRKSLARLNPDGSLDASFDPGTAVQGATVYCLAPGADCTVVVGGSFTKAGGASRNEVARLYR